MRESAEVPRCGPRPRLVFAGAGHAHLFSLKRTAALRAAGADVTLVSTGPFLGYSGTATGVLSGTYDLRKLFVDARRLVEGGGGTFVSGRVERILPAERVLVLEGGGAVPYDLVSFCLGSETREPSGLRGANVFPVKPVENLLDLRRNLLDRRLEGRTRLLVAGGGAAGCEVAANAAALLGGRGVTLVQFGPEVLAFAPKKARRLMLGHLRRSGVEVLAGRRATSFGEGRAVLDDGRNLPADLLAAATGVEPPALFARSGLATGTSGGLFTDRFLRSVSDGRVFGAGDCVDFRGDALPRFGVYAIHQGPILFHNLLALLEGGSPKPFKPRRRNLYVMNLGDGSALAVYGRFAWSGRSAMKLKDYIDRKFLREYRA